ncbi:hypothetical protein EYC80_004240 [Monilinia laxa]|uniref:Uncharacterized protein n=1 Tax=Monilinia laxa TaxID=61186 RepID=A0A5N6KMD9_MONLA|nr:hypothetical protein EYC80_004240 [Monilinia laxa]
MTQGKSNVTNTLSTIDQNVHKKTLSCQYCCLLLVIPFIEIKLKHLSEMHGKTPIFEPPNPDLCHETLSRKLMVSLRRRGWRSWTWKHGEEEGI